MKPQVIVSRDGMQIAVATQVYIQEPWETDIGLGIMSCCMDKMVGWLIDVGDDNPILIGLDTLDTLLIVGEL